MKRLRKTAVGLALCLTMTLAVMMSATLVASAAVSVDVSGQIGYVDDTYCITYDANGGDGGCTGLDVAPGGTDSVLPLSETGISRSGYAFLGWNTAKDGSGKHYYTGDKITLNSNVTLYAQWKEIKGEGAPQTGDNSNMALRNSLLFASSSLLVLLLWAKRRKKNNETQTQGS